MKKAYTNKLNFQLKIYCIEWEHVRKGQMNTGYKAIWKKTIKKKEKKQRKKTHSKGEVKDWKKKKVQKMKAELKGYHMISGYHMITWHTRQKNQIFKN